MVKRRKPGFGLAEILVAIAIFSIAIVILLGTLTSSSHAVRVAEDQVCAQDVAQRLLEDERSLPYASMATSTNRTYSVDYQNNGATVTVQYTYDVVVTTLTNPVLKDLQVTVRWAADGVNRTTTLETAVYQ